MTNYKKGPLDPDRFQMKDIKRRLSRLEKAVEKLTDRYDRHLTKHVNASATHKDLDNRLEEIHESLGMLFGSIWDENSAVVRRRLERSLKGPPTVD